MSTARIETDSGDIFDLRMCVDRAYVGALDVGSTPFIPIAAVAAANMDEDLWVDDPVSPAVVAGSEHVTRVFSTWWGSRPVTVTAPMAELSFPPGPGHALFFTRGVDSTFSLLRSLRGETPEVITHLLNIDNIDHWISPVNRRTTFLGTRAMATRVGLPLIPFTTNAREFLDPIVDWRRSHGAVLASSALLVGARFSSTTIAASFPLRYPGPLGSHIDIDHHWSSERTRFHHDGAEATRPEKLEALAEEPELVRHLKVCWVADIPGNCGGCPKCLLTMAVLESLGALEPGIFESDLSLEAIRSGEHAIPREILLEHVDWLDGKSSELRDAWLDYGERHGLLEPAEYDRCRPSPVGRTLEEMRRETVSHTRAVDWCLVDAQSEGAVALVDRLTARWGPGVCYLEGVPWDGDQTSGLSAAAKDRLMGTSRIRLWWSDGDELDVDRMYESLRNGCVPFQAMTVGAAEILCRKLPSGLRDYVLPCEPDRTPSLPNVDECDRLRHRAVGLVGVAAGEREMLVDHG
ncbi:MAG: hypothetical protein M5U31_01745 [Acidimicrobiia bacterium]|nr:hypothetical protein [Acidimicrobiia bacterium]